jgi:hypothetical protein
MKEKAKTKVVDSTEKLVQIFVQSPQIQVDGNISIRAVALARARQSFAWRLRARSTSLKFGRD